MKRIRLVAVVGARPNFMKVAPLAWALRRHRRFELSLVHTGQHYDGMSDPFFRQLRLPRATHHLGVGSRPPPEQIALILRRLAPVLERLRPRLVLVAGDVNSTLAAALTANKMGLPVAHIEAGLRSFDETMPEEHNRRLTDALSQYCFTPSADADRNLRREGIPRERIFRVGNLMIDSLRRLAPAARRSRILQRIGLVPERYAVATLHRPSNVDRPEDLRRFGEMLFEVAERIDLAFPVHPRTQAAARALGIWRGKPRHLHLLPPLPYLDFLRLLMSARVVLTDSGGVQEETTVLGVPCLTLRENTERPITLSRGTNRLAGTDPARILDLLDRILARPMPAPRRIALWDGRAARRVVEVLEAGIR